MELILFALWIFLPGGYANAIPVFTAHAPFLKHWDTPLDFGKTWRGKPLFGKHKTWRGLFSGIVIAILTLLLQQYCYNSFEFIREISRDVDYSTLNILVLGTLFGAGTLLGDAIESFFKRQASIAPGSSWFPFDQIDYIIGGLLAISLVIRLSVSEYAAILILWFSMHLLFSFLGYKVGLKDKPI